MHSDEMRAFILDGLSSMLKISPTKEEIKQINRLLNLYNFEEEHKIYRLLAILNPEYRYVISEDQE